MWGYGGIIPKVFSRKCVCSSFFLQVFPFFANCHSESLIWSQNTFTFITFLKWPNKQTKHFLCVVEKKIKKKNAKNVKRRLGPRTQYHNTHSTTIPQYHTRVAYRTRRETISTNRSNKKDVSTRRKEKGFQKGRHKTRFGRSDGV